MLFSLLLTACAVTCATLATYLYDDDATLGARLCAGACTGLAALGLLGYILSAIAGLNWISLSLTALIFVVGSWYLWRGDELNSHLKSDCATAKRWLTDAVLRPRAGTTDYLIFYLLMAAILTRIYSVAAFTQDDGGIFSAVTNNYGDLPFHISAITSFAFGNNFPPQDPTYAGVKFTYPFITDFISALYVRAGAGVTNSILLESLPAALGLFGVLQRFGARLTQNRLAGALTPVLVFLSGGIGWILFLKEARDNERGIWGALWNAKQQYTIQGDILRWGNAVTTLLVPQRGILLGLGLAVTVFTLWWLAVEKRTQTISTASETGKTEHAESEDNAASPTIAARQQSLRRILLAAGCIAAMLPLIHAHSYVVVMTVGAFIALIFGLRDWRAWGYFFAAAVVLALPQMIGATYGSATQAQSFFDWKIGWDRQPGVGLFWFWFKNTGFFIPFLIAALLWKSEDYLVARPLLYFFLPFTLCFIVPNFVQLSPWIWDNIKVLFYFWVAAAPLVALLLAEWWQRGKTGKRGWRVLAAAGFLAVTFAGAVDVFSVARGKNPNEIFSANGVAFAAGVRQNTPPRALILNMPTFNTPIFLTGRQTYMGYPAHVWSHGIKSEARETEARAMYAGGIAGAQLLQAKDIEYVVIGPQEINDLKADAEFFAAYPLVYEFGGYKLYRVPR